MLQKILILQQEIEAAEIKNLQDLETFRRKFISKKGVLAVLLSTLQDAKPEEKKEIGVHFNSLRKQINEKFSTYLKKLKQPQTTTSFLEDMTIPPYDPHVGTLHPLTIITSKIIKIFKTIGFNNTEGPEIVNDWYNFTALNFPHDHPARAMHDTFFISKDPDFMLRTHNTTTSVRTCEEHVLPIRTIAPGRVFRNEAISARSHCVFHQIDGAYINRSVNLVELKETMYYLVKELFGEKTKLRFRGSYFPFTEPSVEIDINCLLCQGDGCQICKSTGWVEILGAGMIDPNVLENCKIDSHLYTGFAFGMGIERITMLYYRIEDLRLFFENNLNFLNQFKEHN